MEISKEEFSDWKQHPVTKQFFQQIKEERDAIAERVLSGQFVGNDIAQDRVVLMVQIYDQILNTEFEDDE